MQSILDIRLQKLFLIILTLKILSSGLGWHFQYPWSLGFWIPLLLMSAYIVIGLNRRDREVTDEKFADTCYYLGFIFTITSIIFSLFDLPSIGTRIQDIAVRFGAAMVSTVLGLGVRVYLVSFKRDIADAINDAEEAVIKASGKFTEQLVIALEKLRNFESDVDIASRTTVERVNLQVESLSKNHADKLDGFFAELTASNTKAFTLAIVEVRTASVRLAESVDEYSKGMRANLTSIDAKVGAFTEAVTDRLKTTTFPDEYFAKHLEMPLTQLKSAADKISGSVMRASTEVDESSVVLSGVLTKLRKKAKSTEGALDAVLKLTEQQQAVLNAAQGQLTILQQLSSTLVGFDDIFAKTIAEINSSSAVTSELANRVGAVAAESTEVRRALEKSLTEVAGKLGANATATDALATQIGAGASTSKQIATTLASAAAATEMVAGKLAANSAASALVAVKLDKVAAADVETARSLGTLGQNASSAISKVDAAVEQLQVMVRQLASLDNTLRAHSTELNQVAERINEAKVFTELPVAPVNSSVVASGLAEAALLPTGGHTSQHAPQQVVTVTRPMSGT